MKKKHEDKFSYSRSVYVMYCDATAKLKIGSVYKQIQSDYHQVYVREYKYFGTKSQQCSMLSDSDDDKGFF